LASIRLNTPVSENDARKLSVEDTVYLSGILVTARDQVHRRALEYEKEGKTLPLSLQGLALYHCGPIVAEKGDDRVVVAAGPTTSTRMEPFEDQFIHKFGVRVIVGKGGMGERTIKACKEYGAVYCSFTGGAALLAKKGIKKVIGVEWLDLGMAEAMWIFKVEDFGPIIVTIDSRGNSWHDQVARDVRGNVQSIYQKLGLRDSQ
jgi:tartrate/fumarate subfamily iron-sulfur-dependent hydro-lyase beta chain